MRSLWRKLVLFGSLAAVVAFLVVDQPAKGPAVATATRQAAPRTDTTESLHLPDRGPLSRARGELFGSPPPPAPVRTANPAPVVTAPPVPYRFAGRVRKGAEEEILVSKGDFVFPIKVGDTLDGAYRVESISGERIELVYLPLGTMEAIAVSSVLDPERASSMAAGPASAAQSTPVDDRPARLRWEGPQRVRSGAPFSVAIRVNTKEMLRAAPMRLRFAPDVLEPVDVQAGKFFGGNATFSYNINPAGSIFVGASAPEGAPGTDAELFIVTFMPLKGGTTAELSMSALSLQGASGPISFEQPSVFRAAIH